MHPISFAAWFGLLATAFSLFPIAQLDGNHIRVYAMFGRRPPSRMPGLATAFAFAPTPPAGIVDRADHRDALHRGRGSIRPCSMRTCRSTRRASGWRSCALVMFVLCFHAAPIAARPSKALALLPRAGCWWCYVRCWCLVHDAGLVRRPMQRQVETCAAPGCKRGHRASCRLEHPDRITSTRHAGRARRSDAGADRSASRIAPRCRLLRKTCARSRRAVVPAAPAPQDADAGTPGDFRGEIRRCPHRIGRLSPDHDVDDRHGRRMVHRLAIAPLLRTKAGVVLPAGRRML